MSSLSEPDVIWQATVDDSTWRVEVQGTEQPHLGVLVVSRMESREEILREEVNLAYGAIFGPDVSDVQMWMVASIEAIDKYNAQHSPEGNEQ